MMGVRFYWNRMKQVSRDELENVLLQFCIQSLRLQHN